MVIPIQSMDKELYDACESKNVEDIGNLLKRRTTEIEEDDISFFSKDYYLILEFLLDVLDDTHHNSLFDIIKESLSNEQYEAAAFSSLLKIAAKKCDYIILELILNRLEELKENKSRLKKNLTEAVSLIHMNMY